MQLFEVLNTLSSGDWNRLGIVLQAISFICLTPAIFGVERIAKLEKWLEKIRENNSIPKTIKTIWNKWDKIFDRVMKGVIIGIVIVYCGTTLAINLISEALANQYYVVTFVPVVLVTLGIFAFTIFSLSTIAIMWLLEKGLKFLSPEKEQLINWMFVVGVALFFFATVIQFLAVE